MLVCNHSSLAFVARWGSGSPGYSVSGFVSHLFSWRWGPFIVCSCVSRYWLNTAAEGQDEFKSRGDTAFLWEGQKQLWQGPSVMPHYIPVCMPFIPVHISRDREGGRGSGMLPEIIFTGENIDLDFNANTPVCLCPTKTPWAPELCVQPILNECACQPSKESQAPWYPGHDTSGPDFWLLSEIQIFGFLPKQATHQHACVLPLWAWIMFDLISSLTQDPALHFEFSLRKWTSWLLFQFWT